jgi:MFS family permease
MGIGVSAVVVPAYLGEVAPAFLRGRIVMLYEVLLAFGMLAAIFADTALQNVAHNWRWMVGLPCVPGLLIAGAPHLPGFPIYECRGFWPRACLSF